ncbi:MAG: carotenoid oxygenase family protein [Natronomonas sp.]
MDHRLGLRSASELEAVECRLDGTLPAYLDGSLIGNGPADFSVGDDRVEHWFDGLAALRRFDIDPDAESVSVSLRFLRSAAYEHRKAGAVGLREFGTDPDWTLLDRLRDIADPSITDNASITVDRLADRWLALTETPNSIEFDPETLETRGPFRFDDAIAADDAGGSAHCHYDDGETWGFATHLGRERGYSIWRLPDGATTREVVTRIDRRRPAYLHSFALTDRFAVLVESPFRLDPIDVFRGPFLDAFEWTDRPSKFLVVERETGDLVAEPEVSPFFVFHHANAFERDGSIVVDLCAFPDASVMDAFRLDRLDSAEFRQPVSELRRYRIPTDRRFGSVDFETIHPGYVEFPAINYPEYRGRDYRYVYGVGAETDGTDAGFADRLLKIDVETGSTVTYDPESRFFGEPAFVPDPDGSAEDDGSILAVTLDVAAERSELVVLDAGSFEERATATVPEPLPFGFHGQFVPRNRPYVRGND